MQRPIVSLISMLCGAIFIALMAPPCAADEESKIQNPEFANWSRSNVGSWVKLQTTSGEGQNRGRIVTTNKLVSRTDTQATVETTAAITVDGKEMSMPPRKRVIPAMIDKSADPVNRPGATVTQGDEEISAAGRVMKCRWTLVVMKDDTEETRSKFWACDQVPGEVVKIEATTGEGSVLTSLVAYEIAK